MSFSRKRQRGILTMYKRGCTMEEMIKWSFSDEARVQEVIDDYLSEFEKDETPPSPTFEEVAECLTKLISCGRDSAVDDDDFDMAWNDAEELVERLR